MHYSFEDRHLETAGDEYYIAPGAQVIGSVRLGRWASIWFNCVLRGDTDWIIVGDGSNVQDGSVIHTDEGVVVTIGNDVSIGHAVLLHGCTIGNGSLIGNGARVLDGVRVGSQCLIAAGSLIPPNKDIPDRSVVMGAPGKVVRQVTDQDIAMMAYAAEHYRGMISRYRREIPMSPSAR